MKEIGILFSIVVALAIVLVALFGLTWADMEWQGLLGARQADIDREIFENSKSYNHSKAQDLSSYRLQYLTADTDDEKAAIASTIRIQFAEYNPEKLENEELRKFLDEIMNPTQE